MKKIYNSPVTKSIVLYETDDILLSVSGRSSLDSTEWGGETNGEVTDADARGLSSKSLWDTEW